MTSPILRVGLTGNIAAGKSTVAGWLDELGCHVIDLDRVAHDCLEPTSAAFETVVAAFGSEIVGPGGEIDRGSLGRIVFDDPAARRKLEEILHPQIRLREGAEVEELARGGWRGVTVTEAALLYETGGASRYDRMVVVTAPDPVRLQRLTDRGMSRDDAVARMEAQMSQQEKAALADYVIDNGGELEAARARTERLLERLQDDLARIESGKPLGPPEAFD